MGYLDGLIEPAFTKRRDGQEIFFPYGIFGTGYVVHPTTAQRIRTFLRNFYSVFFPVAILSVITVGVYSFVLLAIFVPLYATRIRSLLSGAVKAPEKLDIKEARRRTAQAMGFPTCLFLLIVGIVLFLMSAAVIFLTEARIIGLLGLVFSGAGVFYFASYLKYSKTRNIP